MKKSVLMLALTLLVCGLCLNAGAESTAPADEIEAILEGMTLRERIGQLFIVRPDALDFTRTQEEIDDAKAEGVTALTDALR